MLNRFILAIFFPSVTQSRVLHGTIHSYETAVLRFATLDRNPIYGKHFHILKPFNTDWFSIIWGNGSLLIPSRLNQSRKRGDMISETTQTDKDHRLSDSLYLAFELRQKQ
jgi:hypothetical protein